MFTIIITFFSFSLHTSLKSFHMHAVLWGGHTIPSRRHTPMLTGPELFCILGDEVPYIQHHHALPSSPGWSIGQVVVLTYWDGWFYLACVNGCVRPARGHRRNSDLQGLKRWSIVASRITISILRLKSMGHQCLTPVFTPKLDFLLLALYLEFS